MKTATTKFFPADERGFADHGWLKAKHTFSFASYYDPDRMGFGKIRVLNDDEIAPNMGFGEHPHDNMEIITIPLEGELKHKDSTGQEGIITPGEVQIMSAGKGIRHSEFNPSATQKTKLFQIWVKTAQQNAEPRYDQKRFWNQDEHPEHVTLVSPNQEDSLRVLQDVSFDMHWKKAGSTLSLPKGPSGRGLFIMVVEGRLELEGQVLEKRDAIGLSDYSEVNLRVVTDSQILIIDTPM